MRHGRLAIALMIFICVTGAVSYAGGKGKVLIILRETSDNMNMMIENELKPIQALILDAGFSIDIASETKTVLGSGSSTITPNLKLSDVKVKNYVGVVVPCMAAGGTPKALPAVAIDVVRQANAIGLPIAAQQSGVEVLAKAGVLKGRKYAFVSGDQNLAPEGTYAGNGVVKDGMIITSGACPFLHQAMGLKDGTAEMTKGFIGMMKL
jgi:transcriptional regulator GlxA family with amidase domain